MKKIFYFLAALFLVSAVSCVKEEASVAPSTDSMTVTLGFDGRNDPDRKAAISDSWGLTWDPGGTELIEWDGGSYKLKAEDVNSDNTVTFTASGISAGTVIYFNKDAVYGSYDQGKPGSTNWGKLYLKGTVAPEGEVTKMKIVGSILRFIPYTTDYPTESVKSVTFESGETSYTVTITNPVTLDGADSKENAKGKSIYLPLAAAEYDSFKVTVRTVSGAKFVFTSGNGKKLTLAENSVVNMSLPLDGRKEAQYAVTFNTDGGVAVPAQTVNVGELAVKPEGVTKDFSGSLSEGLYLGVQDPDNASYTLEGWYKDAGKTQKYDFSTPVTGPLTLYAKWIEPEMISELPETVTGVDNPSVLDKSMAYVNALNLSEETSYTLVVANDHKWQNTLTLNNEKVNLYLVGAASKRTLSRTWNASAIQSKKGHFYVGNNILITGEKYESAPAVYANGGHITLLYGSEVSGCKVNGNARGVIYVNDPTYSKTTMLTIDGAVIKDNVLSFASTSNEYMASTIALNYGQIIIKSGVIQNNKVTSSCANIALCGGIYAPDRNGGWGSEITKTGGIIKGNTAEFSVSEGNVSHFAQQVLFRAVSQKSSGVYKIDQDLEDTDSFTTNFQQTHSPLWVKLTY